MSRNRASAKAAGAKFERDQADWWRNNGHKYAEKMPRYGAKDRGDLANVEHADGQPVALELKDRAQIALPEWWREAQQEAENLGTPYAAIIFKRRGVADPSQQWCAMTVEMLNTILKGKP